MKATFLTVFFLALTALAFAKPIRKADTRCYELRVYYPNPGKYEAIVDRFRQYTTKLFEKHGMENIGYWTPTDGREALYYILAYPSREARDASWKAFSNDPAWKEVVQKTKANGKLVAKVDQIFLATSDISPRLKVNQKSPERTFELRTYTAAPDRLNDVLARFRNHTIKLFSKHGMTNVIYWTTVEKDPSTQPKLVYLLAHESEAAGKKSFDDFRNDPKWIKARDESEKNGKIVEKVESVYMKPTDYSPMK